MKGIPKRRNNNFNSYTLKEELHVQFLLFLLVSVSYLMPPGFPRILLHKCNFLRKIFPKCRKILFQHISFLA